MNNRHRGFTLIELLVVIAILTLLIGILLPSLSAARSQAKANACLSVLKGLGTATTVYLNENRDTFYPVRLERLRPTDNQVFINEYHAPRPRWQWFLDTGEGPIFPPGILNQDRYKNTPDELWPDDVRFGMTTDVFTCAALDDPRFSHHTRDGAFGYNYQYLGNTRTDSDSARWDNFPVGLHQIPSPPQTVLIADSRGAGPKHGPVSFMLDPPRLASEKGARSVGPREDEPDVARLRLAEEYLYSPVEMRHRGQGNVVFVDAHAAAMTLHELGYKRGGGEGSNIPADTAVPVQIDPARPQPSEASNRLWNGKGIDALVRDPG
jgi:prepilin-type N-terminal cleavage/methylation domain-containing protein/prepilin-type processing-associated H-X9-DG protein